MVTMAKVICSDCLLEADTKAQFIVESILCPKGDVVDGFEPLKVMKANIHRLLALGLRAGESDRNDCFCAVMRMYLLRRGPYDVGDTSILCMCCQLKDGKHIRNMFDTALRQVDQIDAKETRPLVFRLNKKVNVLTNLIRQLDPYVSEICECDKHAIDDKCVCGVHKHLRTLCECIRRKLVGCAGIEDNSLLEIENVTFADQRLCVQDAGFVTGDITSNHEMVAMGEQRWSLERILGRPMLVGNYSWNKDVKNAIVKLVLPGDVFKNTVAQVIDSFAYFRGSLVIRIQVNGTKFHVGKLIAYYIPYTSAASMDSNYTIDACLGFPNVVLDASMANSGELTIPFTHMMSYLPTGIAPDKHGDMRFLGRMYIQPLNSLAAASGVSQSIGFSVWTYFKDVELHQPYTHAHALPIGSSGVLDIASDVLDIGNKVKSFGIFDKPIVEDDSHRWVPVGISDIAHGKGPNVCTRLALTPGGLIKSVPGIVGSLDFDMQMKTLCEIKTRLITLKWSKSGTSGTLLKAIPVYPSLVSGMEKQTQFTLFSPTMLAYCSRTCAYWRGSININFDCASSIMHSGRLAFVYVAGKYDLKASLSDVRDGAMAILDLQENKSLEVRLPFMASVPWLRCDKFLTVDDQHDYIMSPGTLYVFVLNALSVPSGTPNDVFVNVLIGAGADFKLSVPVSLTSFLSSSGVPVFEPPSRSVVAPRGSTRESRNRNVVVAPVRPVEPDIIEPSKPSVSPFASAPLGIEVGPLRASNDFKNLRDVKRYTVWDPLVNKYVHHGWSKYGVGAGSPMERVAPARKGYYNFITLFAFVKRINRIYYDFDPRLFYVYEVYSEGTDTRVVERFTVDWGKYRTTHFIVVENETHRKELSELVSLVRSLEINGIVAAADWYLCVTGHQLPEGTVGIEKVAESRSKDVSVNLSLGNSLVSCESSVLMTEDCMDLQTMLRRHYPFMNRSFDIPNTDIKDLPYVAFPVTPAVGRENRLIQVEKTDAEGIKKIVVVGSNNYTTLNHFANLFTFWRGGMRYKILMSGCKERDMAMIVAFLPTVSVEYNEKINYMSHDKLLSLLQFGSVLYQGKVQSSVEFEVPFQTCFNQLQISNVITSNMYDLTNSCGTIVVGFIGNAESLDCTLTIFSALADDTVLTFARAPPNVYIMSDNEQKRDTSIGSKLKDFRLGPSLFNNTGVPFGAMGLFSLFSKTTDVVEELHKNLPQITDTVGQVNKLSTLLNNMLTKSLSIAHGVGIISDILSITDCIYRAMECTDNLKLFYIVRILVTIALRCGMSIGWLDISTFVGEVWSFLKGWWPKVRNTPMGSSGTFDIAKFFLPICVGITTLLFGGLKCDVNMCKSLLPLFRFVNDGSRAGKAISAWIEPYINWLRSKFAENVQQYFPGLASWLSVTDKVNEMLTWMQAIDMIEPEYAIIMSARDPNYKLMIYKLYDQALDFVSHISRGDDKHMSSIVREYAKIIMDIRKRVGLAEQQPASRIDPFCFCLVGKPGCGKSAIIPTIVHNLLNRMNYPRNNRIYNRNTSDKFWSRYKGEIVTVIDDYDQIVDSPAIAELIDLKTNNVYQLNMADVAEKGRLFMSEMVALTSNNMYPTANILNCQEALWRRRNMLIEVIDNGMDRDELYWTHLWFRLRNPIKDSPPGPILSLEELCDEMYTRANTYLNSQRQLVLRNEGLNLPVGRSGNVFKLNVDKVMLNPEMSCFSHEMFDAIEASYERGQWYWCCNSDDTDIVSEWAEFNAFVWNMSEVLVPCLQRDRCDKYKQFVDYVTARVKKMGEVIWDHPLLSGFLLVMCIFVGLKYLPQMDNAMKIASNDLYTQCAQKPARVFAIAANDSDVCAERIISNRILPYIYKIRVLCHSDVTYGQNIFAVGRRWVVTTKHLFTQFLQAKEDIVCEILYCGEWVRFVVPLKNTYVIPDKDLIFLNLDSRFHEHRSNLPHLVRESDLGKLREVKAQYVGSWNMEEKCVVDTVAKPLEECVYINPINTQLIHIYRAWQYVGSHLDKSGTCGGVLVAINSKLKGKIIGVHCAGGGGFGYAHLLTREMLTKVFDDVEVCVGMAIPDVIGPLPATFPEGHFGYVGVVKDSVGAVNKTELVRSQLHGKIGEVTTGPSVLSSKDERLVEKCSPMYNAIAKLGTPSSSINEDLLNLILSYKCDRYRILGRKYARVLTEREAILGIEGAEYIDRINMSTSPGHPYVLEFGRGPGKAWLFDANYDVSHSLLRERIDIREKEARSGNRVLSIWIDCLKDEKRPLEKIRKGNTRLFQIPPLDFTIVMRKYFLGYVAARMEKRNILASQVGINPYGPEWTRLYFRLTKFSPYFICGDYKNFDKSTPPELMMMYAKLANHFYQDENDRIRLTLLEELVHTMHISVNKVWISHHGNPSGNPITTDMNGEVNENLMIFAWLLLHSEAGLATTISEFYESVDLIVYGDDNVLSIKREKTDIFHQQGIAYVLEKYLGIVYTDATKNGVSGFSTIDDVVFLKNTFRNHPVRSIIKMACLDKNTIREMCNWVKGAIDITNMSKENALTSCRFAYFYGKEFFLEWRNTLENAFKESDIDWFPPNYNDLDVWYLNQFDNDVSVDWFNCSGDEM